MLRRKKLAESGSIVWPSSANSIWRLNYALPDSPDEEGIVISRVYFKNHQVFYKASLPSLRVQYVNNVCGPYKDPLNDSVAKYTFCGFSSPLVAKICKGVYYDQGMAHLYLRAYYTIGSYRLTQYWILREDGVIFPQLWSAGLQCNANHKHHTYWRFDFDIDGSTNDIFFEYNSYDPDVGYGRGWRPLQRETNGVKNPGSNRRWAVMDNAFPYRGYQIRPGANDGFADYFSARDFWCMIYRSDEDKHGRQGNAWSDNLDNYLNGEDLYLKDIVMWYCGHLIHEAHDGGDEWHSVGPILRPFRY
jgi:hypothetical protein